MSDKLTQYNKQNKINKMINKKSSVDTIEEILNSITDEAERNLIRIFNYTHNEFEYQTKYFDLNTTVFVPNIYRLKNNTFYILNFIDCYRDRNQKFINEFIEKYPSIKLKRLSLKQYRRIIAWFQDDILFECEKYVINFSKYNKKRIKCNYCGKKFFSENKSDQYCSEECLLNAHNRAKNKSVKRKFYSGYYMDIHHYVRSGWEHNIARILQICNLDYDYECFTFKLSNGTSYIPDFYVYADDTFYEVKGEMRTNSIAKYNKFREEYPDKKLIIIDNDIYNNLLKQFPEVNFNRHVFLYFDQLIKLKKINNYKQYRSQQIHYEDWELNYEFYTNQRYDNNSFNLSILDVCKKYNLTARFILRQCRFGSIEFAIKDNEYYFNENNIEEQLFKEQNYTFSNMQAIVNSNAIINQLNLHIDNDSLIDLSKIRSKADLNIIRILRYLNLECYYEHKVLFLSYKDKDFHDDILLSKIYVSLEDRYYFCSFDYDMSTQNKISRLAKSTDLNCKIINNEEYQFLLEQFSYLFNKQQNDKKKRN